MNKYTVVMNYYLDWLDSNEAIFAGKKTFDSKEEADKFKDNLEKLVSIVLEPLNSINKERIKKHDLLKEEIRSEKFLNDLPALREKYSNFNQSKINEEYNKLVKEIVIPTEFKEHFECIVHSCNVPISKFEFKVVEQGQKQQVDKKYVVNVVHDYEGLEDLCENTVTKPSSFLEAQNDKEKLQKLFGIVSKQMNDLFDEKAKERKQIIDNFEDEVQNLTLNRDLNLDVIDGKYSNKIKSIIVPEEFKSYFELMLDKFYSIKINSIKLTVDEKEEVVEEDIDMW